IKDGAGPHRGMRFRDRSEDGSTQAPLGAKPVPYSKGLPTRLGTHPVEDPLIPAHRRPFERRLQPCEPRLAWAATTQSGVLTVQSTNLENVVHGKAGQLRSCSYVIGSM